MKRTTMCGVLVALVALVCACSPKSAPEPQPWPVTEPETEPRPTPAGDDEWDPPDTEPGSKYDWAPDDVTIRWHTARESEATREEWADLAPTRELGGPGIPSRDFSERYEARFDLDFAPSSDRELLGYASRLEYPAYVGVGAPFLSDGVELHMFECKSTDEVWRVEDTIIACYKLQSVYLFYLAPEPGTSAESPPRLSAPLLAWWSRYLNWPEMSDEEYLAMAAPVTMYSYIPSTAEGVVAPRHVRTRGGTGMRWDYESRVPPDRYYSPKDRERDLHENYYQAHP